MDIDSLTMEQLQEITKKHFAQQLLKTSTPPTPTPTPTEPVKEKKVFSPPTDVDKIQAFKNCVVTWEPGAKGWGLYKFYDHKCKMPLNLFKGDVKKILEHLPKAFTAGRLEQKNINDIHEQNGWVMLEGKYDPPKPTGIDVYPYPADRVVYKYPIKTYVNAKGVTNNLYIVAQSYEKNVVVWLKSEYFEEGKSHEPKAGGTNIMILIDEDLTPLQEFTDIHNN